MEVRTPCAAEKRAKTHRDPLGYRPLCLLSNLAKVFERLIAGRLKEELEARGGLHPPQYGFKKGRATVDAINRVLLAVDKAAEGTWRTRKIPVVVLLDIRVAFGSVSWECILSSMRKRGISMYLQVLIEQYFVHRGIIGVAEG